MYEYGGLLLFSNSMPPQPSLLRYNRAAAFVCKTFLFARSRSTRRSTATKVFHIISCDFIKLLQQFMPVYVTEFIWNFRGTREYIYNAHKIYSYLPTSAVAIQAAWKYYGRISGRGLNDHSKSAFKYGCKL
jgi:hypothetical protein